MYINYQGKKVPCVSPRNVFGNERIRILELLKLKIFLTKNGIIFLESRDQDKKQTTIKRFSDINSCIRSQDHTLKYYQGNHSDIHGEIFVMQDIDLNISLIISAYENWSTLHESKKKNTLAKIEKSQTSLEKSRLKIKKEISSQLELLSSFEDSKDRENIGAKKASQVAAKIRTEKRIEKSFTRMDLAKKRKAALLIEKGYQQRLLTEATIKFGVMHFGEKQLNKKDSKIEKNKIFHLLQSIWSKPFFDEATRLQKLVRSF
ncbi:hypothetical protein C0583_03360 [Candidatus Parcubacteria bacterium]|nr:MAG: hypothetical protein C0583_03360 [Candidatus Parcubacteria bacterium]